MEGIGVRSRRGFVESLLNGAAKEAARIHHPAEEQGVGFESGRIGERVGRPRRGAR